MAIAALITTTVPTLGGSVEPALAFGSRNGAGTCFTGTFTAVPEGGLAPYTYLWSIDSGDAFTILTGTAASTGFSISINFGEVKTAVAECVITDSSGQSASVFGDVTAMEISYF